MFVHLKLGLRRHQLAWVYEQLNSLLNELIAELQNLDENADIRQDVINQQLTLTIEFLKYKNLFEETL